MIMILREYHNRERNGEFDLEIVLDYIWSGVTTWAKGGFGE